MSSVKFEIMAIDSTKESNVITETNLLHYLLSNSEYGFGEQINVRNGNFHDTSRKVSVKTTRIDIPNDESDDLSDFGFLVVFEGPEEAISELRLIVVRHLKKSFNTIYVLEDDVSKNYCKDIYFPINEVENLLRKYVQKFFITKIGSSWWKKNADSNISEKVRNRTSKSRGDKEKKRLATRISECVGYEIFLIDFGDLGRIVHSSSSGALNKQDLIDKINSFDDIGQLREEIQSNYTRFFKSTFREHDFQTKWEELEKIRHVVAHNAILHKEDKERALILSQELKDIISVADEKLSDFNLTDNELDNFKAAIYKETASESIEANAESQEILLELQISEEWSLSRSKFVGLTSFIRNRFPESEGYSFFGINKAIHKLAEEGLIKIYDVPNIEGTRPVTAIKLSEEGLKRIQ